MIFAAALNCSLEIRQLDSDISDSIFFGHAGIFFLSYLYTPCHGTVYDCLHGRQQLMNDALSASKGVIPPSIELTR
jgi:hypothetical protein